jgi:hypothetical protein
LLSTKNEFVREKDIRIQELEKDLRKYYDNEILFEQLVDEIKINYSDLKKISFAREFVSNFKKIDTVNIISLKWKAGLKEKERKSQERKFQKWMEKRMKLKNIEIRQLK